MSEENKPNVDEGTQTTETNDSAALQRLLAIAEEQKAQIDQTKQAKQQEAAIKAGQTYAQLAQAAKQDPQKVLEHFGIDASRFQQTSQAPAPTVDTKLTGRLEKLEQSLKQREEQERQRALQTKLDEAFELVNAHIESNQDKYPALSKVGDDYRYATFNKLQADINAGKKTSEAEAASYVDSQLMELAENLYDLVAERRKKAQKPEEKKEESQVDLSSSTVGDDLNLSRNQKLAKLAEAVRASIKQ